MTPHTPASHPLAIRVRASLRASADPAKAQGMARYMRNRQPFLGVQAPEVKRIAGEAARTLRPEDGGGAVSGAVSGAESEAGPILRDLWNGEFREERYAAIRLADAWRLWRLAETLPLCRWMIHTGAWWDLVDPLTTRWVSPLLLQHPGSRGEVFAWIDSPDAWLRRAAVLSQIKFRQATDREALGRILRAAAPEEDFFLRKAVGWALREFAKSDPDWVRNFVTGMGESLSPLSRREALKNL